MLRELGAVDVPTGMGWVRMSCPFHDDRRPSAAVNHEINGFICYSCERSGDALKLLKDELGLTYREAIERAALLDPDNGDRQRRFTKHHPSGLLERAL